MFGAEINARLERGRAMAISTANSELSIEPGNRKMCQRAGPTPHGQYHPPAPGWMLVVAAWAGLERAFGARAAPGADVPPGNADEEVGA